MANLFTYNYIRKLYNNILWKRGDNEYQQVVIDIPDGEAVVVHRHRVMMKQRHVGNLLVNNLYSDVMRSKGDKGVPWFSVNIGFDGVPLGGMDYARMIYVLAMASECLTLSKREIAGIDGCVTYVILEDVRISRENKLRRSTRRKK